MYYCEEPDRVSKFADEIVQKLGEDTEKGCGIKAGSRDSLLAIKHFLQVDITELQKAIELLLSAKILIGVKWLFWSASIYNEAVKQIDKKLNEQAHSN